MVRAVVRELKEQGLDLPTRVTAQEGYGSLVWKAPTLSAVIRILHNPAYAGAYVYACPRELLVYGTIPGLSRSC